MEKIKGLKIILSKEDNSLDSAKKIQHMCKLKTDIIYIEDLESNNELTNIVNNNIIYFLCNGNNVFEIIKKIENIECIIINKDFLIKNYRKDEVQKILYKNNILVPKIFDKENVNNLQFPIFCKENAHTAITIQMYNKTALDRFFNKFNINDFYFEETINGKEYTTKEIKIYFIHNEVFCKDGEKIHNFNIKEICKETSKLLDNIEIFSLDFIENTDGLYIIDINPASGFYYSSSARRKFVEIIEGY